MARTPESSSDGWLQGGVGLSEEPYGGQAERLQFFMAEATRRFSPAQKEQLIEIIRALLRGYEVPR